MKVNTTSTNYFFCKSKKMIFIISLFYFHQFINHH